jgi:hypothetical protein
MARRPGPAPICADAEPKAGNNLKKLLRGFARLP